jgi:hypothetical protein
VVRIGGIHGVPSGRWNHIRGRDSR